MASQSTSAKGNTITFTYSTTASVKAKTCVLYLLANGANIVTYGSSSTNAPGSTHSSGGRTVDMTPPIGRGSSTGGLNYTDKNGAVRKIAGRVVFDYTYSEGTFAATVTIYDPDPSLSGIAFVGLVRSGSDTWYYDIGGTQSVSDPVYRMHHPEEGSQPESGTDPAGRDPGGNDEAESRKRESQSREHESRKEDIRESILDINDGGSGGSGKSSPGGENSGGGGGKSHRPPCILRRLMGHFSS